MDKSGQRKEKAVEDVSGDSSHHGSLLNSSPGTASPVENPSSVAPTTSLPTQPLDPVHYAMMEHLLQLVPKGTAPADISLFLRSNLKSTKKRKAEEEEKVKAEKAAAEQKAKEAEEEKEKARKAAEEEKEKERAEQVAREKRERKERKKEKKKRKAAKKEAVEAEKKKEKKKRRKEKKKEKTAEKEKEVGDVVDITDAHTEEVPTGFPVPHTLVHQEAVVDILDDEPVDMPCLGNLWSTDEGVDWVPLRTVELEP